MKRQLGAVSVVVWLLMSLVGAVPISATPPSINANAGTGPVAPVAPAPNRLGYIPRGVALAGRGPNGPAVASGGTWSSLGPQPLNSQGSWGLVSGRTTSLAVDPTNSATVYVGTTDGGVWKTTDSGLDWAPLTDSQISLAIGALAIDSTGQVIYAGTGEDNFSADSEYGQGILKSSNGGASWSLVGQSTFAGRHIGSIVIQPGTSGASQKVYVATDGGLFISTDGGASWSQDTAILAATVLNSGYSYASGGVTQLAIDPTSGKLWAAISDSCGTEKGNLATSSDGGVSWTNVNSFPTLGTSTRLAFGLGVGSVAYVAAADCTGALADLQKSTDDGSTWASLSGATGYANYLGGQGWYDTVVAVDPANANRAAFAGVDLLVTTTGGSSFKNVGLVYNGGPLHPDFHALAFTGARAFYVGNDGGVWRTADMGGTGTASDWTNLNATLQISEFYQGSAPDQSRYLGGTQDNGTPGNFFGSPALPQWQAYFGGDGGATAIDPAANSTNTYLEYVGLDMFQVNASTDVATAASPCDSFGSGTCTSGGITDNVQFIAPFVMDQTNSKRLLAGTSRVFETTNGGVPAGSSSWHAISPNLTSYSGDALNAIAIGGSGVIVTGSGGGAVYETINDGGAWANITGNLPAGWVTSVAVNPHNAAEAWLTFGYVSSNPLWHTTNAGAPGGTTWTSLSGTGGSALPNAPANSVLVDPADPNTIFAGTYYGAWVCESCGGVGATPNWSQLGSGMPNAAIGDITVTTDTATLVAWTRGRGAWTIPNPRPANPVPVASSLSPSSATAGGGGFTLTVNGSKFIPSSTVRWNGGARATSYVSSTKLTATIPSSDLNIGHAQEFVVPFPAGDVDGDTDTAIAAGPDGNVWFAQQYGNNIGRITPSGTITEFPITANAGSRGITTGPDGNLWFTESSADKIGRMSPTGTGYVEFTVPSPSAEPAAITTGPDGNLWFAEYATASKIGRITPTGSITEFTVPTSNAIISGITTGPDGNLWFSEYAGKIGRITPGGTITEFPVGSGHAPESIAAGADGNLWFTDPLGNAIGRITPTGTVTEYSLGIASVGPEGITAGGDGNLWFAEYGNDLNQIGRVTTSGSITLFPLPAANRQSSAITAGPDGNLWFVESNANQIGAVTPTSALVSVANPAPGGGVSNGLAFTVTTNKPVPTLTYTGTTAATTNAAITLSATLTVNGTGIPGETISFLLNGVTKTASTNSSGVAATGSNAPATAGPYPISVTFAGDATYAAASTSATLTVSNGLPAPTLAYTGATSANAGASITLKAKLTTSAGVAIAGRTISFLLNGVTFTHVTNTNGVATVPTTAPSTGGAYPIGVTFAGDSTYGPASTSATLSVAGGKPVPVLTYTGVTSVIHGHSFALKAKMTKAGGGAISGETITFTFNGANHNAVTNANGVASANVVAPTTPKSYAVSATFAGDATYAGTATNSSISVT